MKNSNLINIAEVIRNSESKILRSLPKFVVNYIKKVLCEQQLNDFLIKNEGVEGIKLIKEAVIELDVNIKTNGVEKLKSLKGKRLIFVSNHPLGAVDGFTIFVTLSKYFPEFKAIVNDILHNVKQMQTLFLPVNAFGNSPKVYVKTLNKVFESDIPIVIFPAGEVARKQKGKITESVWLKSFVTMAVKHNRDIVPIKVEAQNSSKFYRIAQLRRLLGIKSNIELFLLPQELFKQRGKTIKLYFGNLISYKTFDKTKNFKQWANYVRELTMKLNENG